MRSTSRLTLSLRRWTSLLMGVISKEATVAYWSAVNDSLGGDGEGLRQQIVSEHDGFAITAAVVLSAVVTMLAVAPSNFREANAHNAPASYVLYGALAAAFFLAAECIIGATDLQHQTGKVPAARVLEWVTTFKGSVAFEYALHMIACLAVLSVAAIAMAYLVHGPVAFWVFLGVGCAVGSVSLLNGIRVNTRLRDYLRLDDEGEGGGGAGKAAAAAGGGDGGGDGGGPRGVRLAAAVHPMEVAGRGGAAVRPSS